MGDPPGDVAIYPENAQNGVITADCIKFKPDTSKIITKFAYFYMKSELFRKKVREISAGVAQQKVSLGNFREISLLVPSLEEQTEIVRRVEQVFAFADQLEARVKAAQTRIDRLTQSLLAKAFRGELVPQDPNDEPASVLLARIKAQRAAEPKAKRGRGAAKLS
jgi:type I restriction enzyme S subunit